MERSQPQIQEVVGRELEGARARSLEDARLAVLLDLEGFSEEEMAEVLGCAPGTVKSRLFRPRRAPGKVARSCEVMR